MLAADPRRRPDLDQMVSGSGQLRYGRARQPGSISMSDDELRNLLAQLHARLGGARPLDDDDRRLLVTLLGDVEKALEKSTTAPPPDASGLESLAVKFEADHPALAEGLRRLADTLAKAGI